MGGFLPKSARNTIVTGLLQHVDVPLNVDTSKLTKALGALTGKNCGTCGGAGDFNALIQGRWKLISGWAGLYDGWSSNDPYHVTAPNVTQSFQIVDGSKVWLFDIHSDPEERTNLAAADQLRVR